MKTNKAVDLNDSNKYIKVEVENRSYGELNGIVFYVDKKLPKNDLDYLSSTKGKRGFRFGKHLYERLKNQLKMNFVIVLTADSPLIIEDDTNAKIVLINYETYSKLANNEFIYVRRDAGLSTANKYLEKHFKFPTSAPQIGYGRTQAQQITQSIEEVVDKVGKKNQNELANKIVELIQKKKINLTEDVLKNLSAAAKQSYYESELKKIEAKVKSNLEEKNIKRKWENNFYKPWFKKNYWVFGIDYKKILPKTQITSRQNVDLLLQTYDNYLDIIEVKTPNVNLLSYDKSHNTFYPSPELALAINQAILYINKMESDKNSIDATVKEEGEQAITLKPRCKVVIGSRTCWEKDEENVKKKKNDVLRLLNDSLPNVDIFTFDDILAIGEMMLKMYGKK